VRNTTSIIPLFQSFTVIARAYQGRRASRCSALAPGYYIPRLWRWALTPGYHIPRLWRWALALGFHISAPLALGACPWLSYFRAFGAGRLPLAFIFRAFGAQFRLFVQSRFAVFRVRYYSQPLIHVSTSFNTVHEERRDFSTSRSLAASKVLSAKAREWKLWVATR
jgi:hypothetical protein